MIRLLDIVFALFGILLLFPVFAVIAILVLLGSGMPVFYSQERVGKDGMHFRLMKFRTMRNNADKSGQLTVGADNRITGVGKVLRKYKLDELPQLFNVLSGEMSLVGPRPEVPKYVAMYNEEQRKVLNVRPGITDEASIAYINENEILGNATDPEKTYIEEIMPAKLELNRAFAANSSVSAYLSTIFKTIFKIFR